MLMNDVAFDNIKNTGEQSLQGRMMHYVKKISGPIFTIALIGLIELMHSHGIDFPGILGAFALLILYSVFTGGFWSGVISVLIAMAYHLELLFNHNSLPFFSVYNMSFKLINAFILFFIALMAGLNQMLVKQKVKALNEAEMKLSQREELYRKLVDTQRKQAELSLQGSERKFQILFNNTNDAIFIHQEDQEKKFNNFVEVNDVACKMLGYNRDELLNKTPSDISVDKEPEIRILNEILTKGHFTFERTLLSKDGVLIPVEISSHCFTLNGRKIIQSVVRNITDRKITEAKLRRSEERYRQFVELSPEAIAVHINGKITFVNKAVLNLLGVSSKFELVGKPVMDIIHPDYHQVVQYRINKMYSGHNVKPLMEIQLLMVDGTPVDVEITAAPLPLGESFGVLVFMREISERKLAVEIKKKFEENNLLLSKAIESERLKTEFFINISHELRTPLNVILSALQLTDIYIKKHLFTDNDGKQERHFNIMKQNCNRLLRLVNNLIDITKIDSGYLELSLQNCNIVNVIEEITLSVGQYIENKGINLEFDTEVEEKFLACDPDKIERVILNLLSNSVKFTQPGGSIKVNIYDKVDAVIVSVKDSGVGIPADKQTIIFERFRQVDQSLTRSHEGSGIGLSLVKSLVELHGGKITLESEYGKGSNFIIELPVGTLVEESQIVNKMPGTYKGRIEKVSIEFSDIHGIA